MPILALLPFLCISKKLYWQFWQFGWDGVNGTFVAAWCLAVIFDSVIIFLIITLLSLLTFLLNQTTIFSVKFSYNKMGPGGRDNKWYCHPRQCNIIQRVKRLKLFATSHTCLYQNMPICLQQCGNPMISWQIYFYIIKDNFRNVQFCSAHHRARHKDRDSC